MGSITVTALESVTGIVEIVLPGPQGPVGDIHPSMPGLVQQATDAATSATASALSADTSEANASASATSALASKNAAAVSETTATTKASEASTSATNAAASATTASTKASEASTSATDAAASAAAAATSATDTANALVGERSAVATLTNKTVNLSNNTLTGTTAQFNAALTDGDFATLAGAETLTNKTITGGTTNPTTLQEGGVAAVVQTDIGTEPNQIPLNQYLGPLAYRDENPAGAVVGTTAVQVLSGKSFSDNVGIGTSSPVTPLDVRTSTGASIIAGRTSNTGPASEPGNFEVRAPNASGTEMIWNQINAVINTATAGSEASSMLFKTRSGGAFAERMRIDSAGNVGVGTSSPTGKLHVVGSAGGTYIDASGNQIVMTRAGTNYLISNDPASSLELRAPLYTFKSENGITERLRIDASGNLGIGTSSPLSRLHVTGDVRAAGNLILVGGAGTPEVQFFQSSRNWTIRNNAGSLEVYDSTASAVRATFNASGNLGLGVVPSAWSSLTALHVKGTAHFAGFSSGAEGAFVTSNAYFNGTNWLYQTTAAASYYRQSAGSHQWFSAPSGAAGNPATFTQAMTLDGSGYLRLASGGIQFNGDTAAANALDDYEEGTFTPTIVGSTAAGAGTYTKAVGRYTKVGNVVHFDLYLLWTAHTGTGNMLVADMPFVNSSLDSNYPVFSIFGATIALTANNTLACFMTPNSSQIQIQQLPVGGGANQTVPLDTSAELLISGSYRV